MDVLLNPASVDSYRQFLEIKKLPTFEIRGRVASFPDEYADQVHGVVSPKSSRFVNWEPSPFLFDYQRDITRIALKKRKYAVFADCGLGKTLIFAEFAEGAMQTLAQMNKGMLIVSPLMVVSQTINEFARFYPDQQIEQVAASDLQHWLHTCGGKIGITNYEAVRTSLNQGQLGGLILDESSMLKSHYGKWGTRLIELGKGLEYKLCCTGTPAPNDRIEFANHAVFLDAFSTVNAFLATYFVNRGQTSERWVLKDHALRPFYRSLAHWCIFLTNPATYGWQDNCEDLPPINVHQHHVDLTKEQRHAVREMTGQLFATDAGGIGQRSKLGQLAKGKFAGKSIETNKYSAIAELLRQWPDESTIIWCLYNDEQDTLAQMIPEAASIAGSTKHAARERMIADFKSGKTLRNEWIQWAEHHWSDIKENDTLNVAEGRDEKDVKHICPLQLGVIRRLVSLFSLQGEVVFSPFTGIGSECYESLLLHRRFFGFELKESYHAAAIKNAERAIRQRIEQLSLFSCSEIAGEIDDEPECEELDIRKHCERGGLASPVAKVV